LIILGKRVDEIQVSLQSEMNGCSSWRPRYVFDYISLSSS